MKRALTLLALISLFPSAVAAQPPFGRQLHYAGTKTEGADAIPVSIDVDIGRLDSDRETWIVIDERLGSKDLGPSHVTLNGSGVVGTRGVLTFEEETVLDMVALQFEDVDGVDPGDHWDRTSAAGSHQTHYLVRSKNENVIDFDIARTLDDPSRGSWHGTMRYNAKTAAPTDIEISGDRLGFSVRLVRDSFLADDR